MIIIIHDEDSLEQALGYVSQGVGYSDRYSSITRTMDPELVERKAQAAIDSGEIAVVATGSSWIPDYKQTLHKFRKEQAREDRANVRRWVQENPELAHKLTQRVLGVLREH